eukprot:TRINITY_DN982_c0_g1_i3.p1 TRINITY_DN982_c0_g1~~TRINITY_DN982_c0_g1_i3.p1  ORF type:complete len:235 (-),score=109.29 TRINITY_DN982_c0_g1_i3:723-1427(-)
MFAKSTLTLPSGSYADQIVKLECLDDNIYQEDYDQEVVISAEDNGFGDPLMVNDEDDFPRIAVKQIKIARFRESLGKQMEVVINRFGEINHALSTDLTIQPAGFGGCTVSPSTVNFKSGETDPIVAKITCPQLNDDHMPLGSLFSLALDGDDASTVDDEKEMKITYVDSKDEEEDGDSTVLIVVAVGMVCVFGLAFVVGKFMLFAPQTIVSPRNAVISKEPASKDVSKSFAAVV